MVDPSVSVFPDAQYTTISTVGSKYTKDHYMTSNASTSVQTPPLPPSALFTGHDTYLQMLKDYFSLTPNGDRKKFVLYGMGGIGKTQICLKFIEQYGRNWFSDIFWIDASSEQTINLCLRQITQKYEVDSTPSAKFVLEWISDRNDWFMVFDNVAGGYQVVEKFLPPGNRGGILITSRDKALEKITSPTHSLEVIEMGEEEAIALLSKSAMVDTNSEAVAIVAQKLVAALGYIPLAIDQAGAYMQSCGYGLDNYLELFNKQHAKLMSDKEFRGASLYEYSTYGAWEMSIEEIKHRVDGGNSAQRLAAQSALVLQNIFAFLHHDNIPEAIFKNAALNFMKRKGESTNGLLQSISLLNSETLFLDDNGNWNALQFQEGIEVLLSFSLIRKNGMMYSINPLMQTWSRDRIPVANVSACCQKSRSLLACSLEIDYQGDSYRFWTLLAPHIKRNGEHAVEWISDDQYYDDQHIRFAFLFDKVGDWSQAEKMWSEALNAREVRLGKDHPDTLTAIDNLAANYMNQRKWKEAESLQVNVMEARKEKLGAFHPGTLTSMGNLAATYMNQEKQKEAEGLEMTVMEARKEILGTDHPDTLSAMSNLASTYMNQGNWKEAESLQVHVMEVRKEKLGALHPSTLGAIGKLVITYKKQGRWKEAESLEVIVMEARKEILGTDHPDTLTAMSNLASTYMNQGNWEEAESLQVHVMEVRKEKLGALHPDTLVAMANLAFMYDGKGQNKVKEAKELLDASVKGMQQVLGLDHPTTIYYRQVLNMISQRESST